jgi:hypothetical protein
MPGRMRSSVYVARRQRIGKWDAGIGECAADLRGCQEQPAPSPAVLQYADEVGEPGVVRPWHALIEPLEGEPRIFTKEHHREQSHDIGDALSRGSAADDALLEVRL